MQTSMNRMIVYRNSMFMQNATISHRKYQANDTKSKIAADKLRREETSADGLAHRR